MSKRWVPSVWIREGFSKLLPELGIHIHYSPLDYPGCCDMKCRIIKNRGLILSLAVIACLQVNKIDLNPEFFHSTDTAYWVSAINQLLEWQSITSNVCVRCQNQGEFPIRTRLWWKTSSQQQREAVGLQGEAGSSAAVSANTPILGESISTGTQECCQTVYPLLAILPAIPHYPLRTGTEARWNILENKTDSPK